MAAVNPRTAADPVGELATRSLMCVRVRVTVRMREGKQQSSMGN